MRSRLVREPRRLPRRRPDTVVRTDDGAHLAVYVDGPEDGGSGGTGEIGGDVPTAVLAHGWTLTATAWERSSAVLREQRPDVRVVRYDQRDHGASSGTPTPPGAASMRRLADDLAAVVEAAAGSGPLVLGGHSMGGMAVLALVRRHPDLLAERVRGVLLCSTAAGQLSTAGRVWRPLMAAAAAMPSSVRVPRAPTGLARRTGYGADADRALVAAIRREMGPVTGRATGTWFAALMAHDEAAALPLLAASGVPVRLLVGDQDRMTPERLARSLADGLPEAHLDVVPRAGHMLLVERPDLVAAALAELLPVV